jgi:L-cysteine:1D-myo-inositol 2-amino-2-deoxy-alpha-D-glucopyranoside ligase
MSKSLGNLVFVSDLRKEWDTRAVRLAVLQHHYRISWEWRDDLMAEATDRLRRWEAAGEGTGASDDTLDEVRAALDDDLDTPAAVAAIDEVVAAGKGAAAGAALLGVTL